MNEDDQNNVQSDTESDDDQREENLKNIEQSIKIIRKRGRPKGVTSDVIEERKHLKRIEKQNRAEERRLRRSERLRNKNMAMMIIDEEIPTNIQEARKSNSWNEWQMAMHEEMGSMAKHKVWDVIQRPDNKKVIKTKWVFNIKEDPVTKERKYKARLVAVGCAQRPGFDFTETFASIVRVETVRLLFSIATEVKKTVKLYDVKTAFLHGNLDEEIYVELPQGYDNNGNNVCKLKKSMYGLRQAERCWNKFLTKILFKNGLRQSKKDPCLFYKKEKENYIFCAIHVDDMIVVSSDEKYERNIY